MLNNSAPDPATLPGNHEGDPLNTHQVSKEVPKRIAGAVVVKANLTPEEMERLTKHLGIGEKSVTCYQDGSPQLRALSGLLRTDIPIEFLVRETTTSPADESCPIEALPTRSQSLKVGNDGHKPTPLPARVVPVHALVTQQSVEVPTSDQIPWQCSMTIQDALRAISTALDENEALTQQVQTMGSRVAELERRETFNFLMAGAGYGQTVAQVAQHFYKGVEVAENTARDNLYRWLRGKGYLIPGTRVPFQHWFDAGLFWVISQTATGAPGTPDTPTNHLSSMALVTAKGFDRFQSEFRLEGVPTKEKDRDQVARYHRN